MEDCNENSFDEEMMDEELSICSSLEVNVDSSDDSDKEQPIGNMAWADAMTKVLTSRVMNRKNFILAKAKKDSKKIPLPKPKDDIEIVDEGGKIVKSEIAEELVPEKTPADRRKELLDMKSKKFLWENLGRSKPDITQKEKERTLVRIATKGIVQLFNAVETHQKKSKLKGPANKKQKTLIATKGTFMDMLKGNICKEDIGETDCIAVEPKKRETWSVLKEDFMMGASLKDWDKTSDNEDDK